MHTLFFPFLSGPSFILIVLPFKQSCLWSPEGCSCSELDLENRKRHHVTEALGSPAPDLHGGGGWVAQLAITTARGASRVRSAYLLYHQLIDWTRWSTITSTQKVLLVIVTNDFYWSEFQGKNQQYKSLMKNWSCSIRNLQQLPQRRCRPHHRGHVLYNAVY